MPSKRISIAKFLLVRPLFKSAATTGQKTTCSFRIINHLPYVGASNVLRPVAEKLFDGHTTFFIFGYGILLLCNTQYPNPYWIPAVRLDLLALLLVV